MAKRRERLEIDNPKAERLICEYKMRQPEMQERRFGMADGTLPWRTTYPATREAFGVEGKSGDLSSAELETLYLIRRPELIRFLVRFGVDVIEAEDIAQEVFLRAFREARHNRHPGNLLAWLTACAKNLAIDRWHKMQKERLVSAEMWQEWSKTLPRPDSIREGGSYSIERKLWLIEALASLDGTEQQCMVMRSEGATFREIAAALQVPLRHAVYLTTTAVQKLRRVLKDFSA